MASRKEYLDYILDCLSGADEITSRAMMNEYIIYCRGKIVGGIYDDRFLIKKTPSSLRLVPDAVFETPYPGGGEMICADVDDRELLTVLIPATADDLPEPKKKKRPGGTV